MPFNMNGMDLAGKKFNPQMDNLGTVEFFIDGLIPGGQEVLRLGLKGFEPGEMRTVAVEKVHFLQGVLNFPGRVQPISEFNATFVDYHDGRQRRVLHQWFDFVYDERTGVGGLKSEIAINAHILLFSRPGVVSVEYLMMGVWPIKDPKIPSVRYEGGQIVDIPMQFAVDYCFETQMAGETFSDIAGTIGAVSAAISAASGFQGGVRI